jgi:formate-dependent nitrite reductase cytochrome c552 subunit
MDTEFEQQLRQAHLGDDIVLRTGERDELAAAYLRMSSQAKFRLDIVSRDLEPAIFDNADYYNAVKQLAMHNPRSRIRILIQNSEHIVKYGHRLIELSRRLSSYIDIRLQGKDFREFNEAWLIIDDCGWIRRPLADRFKGECYFNSPREVQERTKQFNEMWDASVEDPNLRRLHL